MTSQPLRSRNWFGRQDLDGEAFDNAIRADMAIGGSTNAIIHLLALAGRVGVPLTLRRFDELAHTTPLLVSLRPSGKYLMEDFFYAGGLPVVLRVARPPSAGRSPSCGTATRSSSTSPAAR